MTGTGGRRDVLNSARRQVERALASEGAAAELADAAECVLARGGPPTQEIEALRAALVRFRRVRGAERPPPVVGTGGDSTISRESPIA